MTIEKGEFFTMIIEWKIEPEQREQFIDSVCDQLELFMKGTAGFVSASFHASEDGKRIINCGQWQSKEHWVKFENSNDDLDAALDKVKKRFGVKIVKIDSFRVVRVVRGQAA